MGNRPMNEYTPKDEQFFDAGIVVFSKENGKFWTGLGWEKQLRKAKVYHSKLFAELVIRDHPKHDCILFKTSMKLDSIEPASEPDE